VPENEIEMEYFGVINMGAAQVV